jgi:hypothetical protein
MRIGMAAALSVLVGGMALRAAEGRQVIEMRTYSFANAEKMKTFEGFLAKSMIPALNRAGANPVGAFVLKKDDNPNLKLESDPLEIRVLLAHPNAESALALAAKLDADADYAAAAKLVLGTPMKDPVYSRFETQMMLAFEQCPNVEAPSKSADRVLQLRIYESHNDERALRKIAMFNEGGEIGIFRRCGMNPVFFGQSVAGTKMPNLTYMLAFDSPAAQAAAWGKFQKDPDWNKIKVDPKYAETVSTITNLVLRPIEGSQI